MSAFITRVHVREAPDSRDDPTLKAEATLADAAHDAGRAVFPNLAKPPC